MFVDFIFMLCATRDHCHLFVMIIRVLYVSWRCSTTSYDIG